LRFFVNSAVTALVTALGFYRFVLEPSDKKKLTDRVKRVIIRTPNK